MKKAIGLMIAAMALAMMAVSCTPNGASLSLVGKWYKESGNTTYYMEIKKDDTIWSSAKVGSGSESASVKTATIKKATCNKITVKPENGDEQEILYELSGDNLIWGSNETGKNYKKVK
ncbi:MAG: hypothetical protein II707_05875 [Spirochaetales bacterium]|nr:hypothetical protein [Spirochaetales bacterium]